MKTFHAVCTSAILSLGFLLAPGAGAQPSLSYATITEKDLQWFNAPSLPPGARLAVIETVMSEVKPFISRLQFPANYRVPAHFHRALGHLTVMHGSFHIGFGDKFDQRQLQELSTGSVAVIQPGVPHFVLTRSPTVIQLQGVDLSAINYVNPADDPRTK